MVGTRRFSRPGALPPWSPVTEHGALQRSKLRRGRVGAIRRLEASSEDPMHVVSGQLMALIAHDSKACAWNQQTPLLCQSGVAALVKFPSVEFQGARNREFMLFGELD